MNIFSELSKVKNILVKSLPVNGNLRIDGQLAEQKVYSTQSIFKYEPKSNDCSNQNDVKDHFNFQIFENGNNSCTCEYILNIEKNNCSNLYAEKTIYP